MHIKNIYDDWGNGLLAFLDPPLMAMSLEVWTYHFVKKT